MRNLRVFENLDEFTAIQQQLSGTGRFVLDIVPGYSYIRQEYLEGREGSRYNLLPGQSDTPFDTRFGNVVYLDPATNTLNTVWWEDYTEDMGEKVGLIVISQEDAPDGNARMIAFTDAFKEDLGPKSDVMEIVKLQAYWSDMYGNGEYNTQYQSARYAQTMYNETQYPIEDDFSGYTWTYKYNPKWEESQPELLGLNSISPVDNKHYYFPHEAAAEFYTEGSQKGDWYVPAAGEMQAGVMDHFEDIRRIMSELCIREKNEVPMWVLPDGQMEYGIKDKVFQTNPGYWTSTIVDISGMDFEGTAEFPNPNKFVNMDYNAQPLGLMGTFNKDTGGYDTQLSSPVWYQSPDLEVSAYIRPMAMIKDGEIVRTMGEATANGHLFVDWIAQGHHYIDPEEMG